MSLLARFRETGVAPSLGYKLLSNQVYQTAQRAGDGGGGGDTTVDLYVPTEDGKQPIPNTPLLVFIHGGLWVSGDKREGRLIGTYFSANADRRMTVACVNYRLSPKSSDRSVYHPTHVREVAACLSWLLSEAKGPNEWLCFNPATVFLMGHSVGAHISGLLLLSGDKYPIPRDMHVRGVVALQGLFDTRMFYGDQPEWRSLVEYGMPPNTGPDSTAWDSPTEYKDSNRSGPWLLIHSVKDPWVSVEQPQRFQAHLDSIGVQCRTELLPEGNHDDVLRRLCQPPGTPHEDLALPLITEFFGAQLARLR